MRLTFENLDERTAMKALAYFIAQDVDDTLKNAHTILQAALDRESAERNAAANKPAYPNGRWSTPEVKP